MKEFALLFRQAKYDFSNMSPLEMQAIAKKWQDWKEQLEAQGKLASHGQRLSTDGKVLKARGVVTDGPFVEIRERLAGFMVVKAENLDEATTLAHGCPVLDTGGSVEIRELL
jgi:hypothetical protein